MINNYKKQMFLTLLLIFILFCVVFCFIFLLKDNPTKKDNNFDLSVKYLNNIDSVTIENILPINDIVGKKLDGKGTKEGTQGYLEFTLKSNSSNEVGYKIIVDADNKSKENIIDDKYIKLYLTDFNDVAYDGYNKNDVPTFLDLFVDENAPSDKILYQGTIDSNKKQYFRLRVWLANDYILSDTNEEKFSVKLRIEEN